MRNFILMLLILSGFAANSQIHFQLPKNLVTENRMRAYVDSVIKAKDGVSTPAPNPVPETPKLEDCKNGLRITNIFKAAKMSLSYQFDALEVYGMDWKILSAYGVALDSGSVRPERNIIDIVYKAKGSGSYVLQISGNTCRAGDSKSFTIPIDDANIRPVPSPVTGLKYEMVLNTTGRGFSATSSTGLERDFPPYIDKFKFSWGWGISGIRVCVRWYDFEPTEGDYQIQGMKNLIEFCRQRNLNLDLCFWPLLKANDTRFVAPFVLSNGKILYSVDIGGIPEYSEASNNFIDKRSNERIKKAVTELSKILYTYERAGSISLGGGKAEELVYPYTGTEISDFSNANIDGFYAWLKSRNIPQSPPVYWAGNPAFVPHNSLINREWLRYNTYTLRQYFDNFVSGVKAGSPKGKACYFTAAVGGPATQWTQDGYLAFIAKNADEFYHSDGTRLDNADRKITGLNYGIGTLDVPTACEHDEEDLGAISGGGFNGSRLYGFAKQAYERGGQKVHLAMFYQDASINNIEGSLKKLNAEYVGKAWIKPILNANNTETVDIENFLWNGGWLDIKKDKYFKAVAPNFWGIGLLP